MGRGGNDRVVDLCGIGCLEDQERRVEMESGSLLRRVEDWMIRVCMSAWDGWVWVDRRVFGGDTDADQEKDLVIAVVCE